MPATSGGSGSQTATTPAGTTSRTLSPVVTSRSEG